MSDLELEGIRIERQVSLVSQVCLAHLLLVWIVEKAEVMKCGISQGMISLREHRTLYRMLIGIITEHLDLGSRSRRGSGDMGDTGENATAAPTYCCLLASMSHWISDV